MHIVAVGWIFVVLLAALAEATSPQGTVLGAIFTVLLWGVLPLALVLYLLGTPLRRRARRRAEGAGPAADTGAAPDSGAPRDRRGHPAGDGVAPEREEP